MTAVLTGTFTLLLLGAAALATLAWCLLWWGVRRADEREWRRFRDSRRPEGGPLQRHAPGARVFTRDGTGETLYIPEGDQDE